MGCEIASILTFPASVTGVSTEFMTDDESALLLRRLERILRFIDTAAADYVNPTSLNCIWDAECELVMPVVMDHGLV